MNLKDRRGIIKMLVKKGKNNKVMKKYPTDSIAFANGGDRNHENIPEVEFAKKHGIGLIWEAGGGKIQSSSDLVNKIL